MSVDAGPADLTQRSIHFCINRGGENNTKFKFEIGSIGRKN